MFESRFFSNGNEERKIREGSRGQKLRLHSDHMGSAGPFKSALKMTFKNYTDFSSRLLIS